MRVLFMQSQTYCGADSRIHGHLMETLDRSCVEVFTALNYGNNKHKSPAAMAIEDFSAEPKVEMTTPAWIIQDEASTE
jgi:hypothetical protein